MSNNVYTRKEVIIIKSIAALLLAATIIQLFIELI